MKTLHEIDQFVIHSNNVVYRNAAINRKLEVGPLKFYQDALELIRYYKGLNSHKVASIQAYCNISGFSNNY